MVLRAAQVIGLAGAPRHERTEKIRAAIDLPGIASSKLSLRAALDQVSEGLKKAKQAGEGTGRTLDLFYRNADQATRAAETREAFAKRRAEEDPAAHRGMLEKCKAALNHLKTVETTYSRMEEASAKATRCREGWDSAIGAFDDARRVQDEAAPELLDVLARLRNHLQGQPAPESCPVCGAAENAGGLNARIEAKLVKMTQFGGLQEEARDAERHCLEAEAVFRQTEVDFTVAAAGLCWMEGDPPTWSPTASLINKEDALARLDCARASRPRMAKHAGISKNALNRVTMLRAAVRNWEASTAEVQRLSATHRRLSALLVILETERKRYADDLLTEISGDFERMYQKMRPGTDPVPLLPLLEGPEDHIHWDTVGICLFLAIAASPHRDGRLVIMDDVLQGADLAYVGRYLDLVEAEAPRMAPLIVTSHYPKCQERYRSRRSSKVQIIELAPWRSKFGVFPVQTRTAQAELRAHIDDPTVFNSQVAAATAGVLLERLLDFLTLHYNSKMPRQEMHNYTLGKLLNGINSNRFLLRDLRTESNDGTVSVSLKGLIDSAAHGDWIRNQVGAHFNSAADDIHHNDVEAFVENVLALADALICTECGELPQTDRVNFWQCGCRHGPRLFPYRSPSA